MEKPTASVTSYLTIKNAIATTDASIVVTMAFLIA